MHGLKFFTREEILLCDTKNAMVLLVRNHEVADAKHSVYSATMFHKTPTRTHSKSGDGQTLTERQN